MKMTNEMQILTVSELKLLPTRAEQIEATVRKYPAPVKAIKILIASGQFQRDDLYTMLHSLMGYCEQGHLWDVATHVELF
jgi:hypothetical protein